MSYQLIEDQSMKLKIIAAGGSFGDFLYLYCHATLPMDLSQADKFIMDFVQINCIPIFWPTLSLILIDTQWIMCKYFHAIFRHLGS